MSLTLSSSRPRAAQTAAGASFGGPCGRLLAAAALLIVVGIIALAVPMSWHARRADWQHAGLAAENNGALPERDYFVAQRDHRGLGLYISPPFMSRLDQVLEIGLSRRIEGPDGSFAGIVVGTMQLEFFRKLFDSVDIGTDGNITLLNTKQQTV